MKLTFRIFLVFSIAIIFGSCNAKKKEIKLVEEVPKLTEFNWKKDLLLLNYDCKTDVDDLHSVAAAASLIRIPQFSGLKYHAVAGSYGTQDGKYVPANSLFELSFNKNWSDAHKNVNQALNEVFTKAKQVLKNGGHIWIAEAGQSDFSSSLVLKIKERMKDIDTQNRIHIVQHSDWNEKVTSSESLAFAKANSNYVKIPDGNTLNNGTPGFNTSNQIDYKSILENTEVIEIWNQATSIADNFNGVDGRYLNKSIKAGGLDFSDFCEVHHILKLEKIENCVDYFNFIQSQN